MIRFYLLILTITFTTLSSLAQQSKLTCTEVYKPNIENPGSDSIIIQTCYLNGFKFVSTGYPDYKGRYSYEYDIYKKVNGRFIKTTNADFFNEKQNELLVEINRHISEEYESIDEKHDAVLESAR